jgi:hypothetical protein
VAYPTLHLLWIENAPHTRWGLPLLPVPLVRTSAADRMRGFEGVAAAATAGRLSRQRMLQDRPF